MRVNPILDTFKITTTLTRSTDATQYTAGDAVTSATTTPLTFTDVGVNNGQTILVTECMVTSSIKSTGDLLNASLWLFNTSPTATADNSAFALTDADNNCVEAVIPLTETNSATNNARVSNYNFERQIVLGSTTRNLFGLLQVNNAYVTSASELFTITVKGQRL
jgi:hypothetical protein